MYYVQFLDPALSPAARRRVLQDNLGSEICDNSHQVVIDFNSEGSRHFIGAYNKYAAIELSIKKGMATWRIVSPHMILYKDRPQVLSQEKDGSVYLYIDGEKRYLSSFKPKTKRHE